MATKTLHGATLNDAVASDSVQDTPQGLLMSEPLKYEQHDWGDLVEGTKDQLQALGIGVDALFPGEPGAKKLEVKTQEVRGFEVSIRHSHSAGGCFYASIRFPGWPRHPNRLAEERGWESGFPGVKKEERTYGDVFTGTAADLVAAGLVRDEHLPGRPGMRKNRVTVLADGTVPNVATTANIRGARAPGARIIERKSTKLTIVKIFVTADVSRHRREMECAANEAWREKVKSLPRPAKLRPVLPETVIHLDDARPRFAKDSTARLVDLASFLAGTSVASGQVFQFHAR